MQSWKTAGQVPAETSGRIFGDTAVWTKALPLCARCWLSFQEKVVQELGKLALEQANGLEQVIAHLWFVFLTFKMGQMTVSLCLPNRKTCTLLPPAVAQEPTSVPFPRAIHTKRVQAQGAS